MRSALLPGAELYGKGREGEGDLKYAGAFLDDDTCARAPRMARPSYFGNPSCHRAKPANLRPSVSPSGLLHLRRLHLRLHTTSPRPHDTSTATNHHDDDTSRMNSITATSSAQPYWTISQGKAIRTGWSCRECHQGGFPIWWPGVWLAGVVWRGRALSLFPDERFSPRASPLRPSPDTSPDTPVPFPSPSLYPLPSR